MRVVSWIIVATSVLWLVTYSMWPTLEKFSMPDVEDDLVTGTASPDLLNPDSPSNTRFAKKYTAAWNSHDPARVASFFDAEGSITINDGNPSTGTEDITGMAHGFMTEFPDIEVHMVNLEVLDDRLVYHWMFTGTHAETGNSVRVYGSETWRLTDDGLIAESIGQFDSEDYERQVNGEL